MMQTPKIELVLMHLKQMPITAREAVINYNYYRLADGIHKLRKRGYNIRTETIPSGSTRFAKYHLITPEAK